MSLENLFKKEGGLLSSRSHRASENGEFNKETWALLKQTERGNLFLVADNTLDNVFYDTKNLYRYLTVQSTFRRMSLTNTLLIAAQMPTATRIATYDEWVAQGRNVKKGAQSISIFEAGDQYRRKDGSLGTGYDVAKVFDIAQTFGAQLPRRSEPSLEEKTRLLIDSMKVDFKITPDITSEEGTRYLQNENTILVSKELMDDNLKLYRALALEASAISYARVTKYDDYAKELFAWEAQCAASIVCLANNVSPIVPEKIPDEYGLTITGISFTIADKRVLLGDIRQAAVDVIESIDRLKARDRQAQKNAPEHERS